MQPSRFTALILRKNSRGFSLIEVLVALSVMMGSLVVISMAWSTSQLRLRKMKINNQVAYLLDYRVAELTRKYKNEITLLPEEDQGDFEDLGPMYKDFTWSMQSKKFELPDLTPLLMQQEGGVDPMLSMMFTQLSDFFNQAAKEVAVTVTYAVKKQKVSYSANTFLIDYSQQLPLPAMGGGGAPAQGN